jgi:holo-[acyl-carrier protein] synthase
MMQGIGIDMIEVERVQRNMEKDAGFREMIFSAEEINYCEPKTKKYEHYAARFAAKEAFFKALGTGWADGTSFNEIEVFHNAMGKPFIQLLGVTKQTLAALANTKISVSLSHLSSIASAIVIIETT